MLLALLARVGATRVALAGLDGFSDDAEKNYFSRELAAPSKGDADENPLNAVMRKELARIAARTELRWLTPSLYR